MKVAQIIAATLMLSSAASASELAEKFLNEQRINFINMEYYSFNVSGCSIAIEKGYSYSKGVTTYNLNAKDISPKTMGRDPVNTQIYPSGDMYAHTITCRDDKKCISYISSDGNKYAERTMISFKVANNSRLGEEIHNHFLDIVKNCGGKSSKADIDRHREATIKEGQSKQNIDRWRDDQKKEECSGLYPGKSVMATTKDILGPSGSEQAIVLGLSASTGMATIKSVRNPNMVGEVPCSSLK